MGIPKEQVDRRQQKRYKVSEGVFVALLNNGRKLGQIQDISNKGLSFRYIDSEDEPADMGELRILSRSEGFFLDGVPFKKISDFEIKSDFSFSLIKMRQMGLQFGKLTSEQKILLDHYIQELSVRES
jgi:hypothetical protein